jgi:SNF2 family DNA or RNA helicase
MDGEQRKIYAANLLEARRELAELAGLPPGRDRIKILVALTRMRQICCDPALLYEDYSGGSVKLEACMDLVQQSAASGHRILLFSQFTSMLDRIESRLCDIGIDFLRIDGSTKPAHRLELVNAFNSGDTPVFLVSLKAGGTGLNLTGADIVIHYDPWWNLSAQNQATDRAHRIGQKNSVQVYKLIVSDTVEERILDLQERKAEIANAIIEENGDPMERLNRDELLALLEGEID